MRWSAVLSILMSMTATACGGKVSFVSDQAKQDFPSQPATTHTMIEKFQYGKPSGTQVIVLGVYPRKSMGTARARVIEFLPSFMDAISNAADGYQGMHFAVFRDVLSPHVEWYSLNQSGLPRSQWHPESLRFLQNSLTHLAMEKELTESESLSPFDNFNRVAQMAASRISAQEAPVWIHYYYFRDGDIVDHPNRKVMLENSTESLKLSFRLLAPLSPFRSFVHLVSYLNAGGECDPLPSRIVRSLLEYLTPFNHTTEELCNILSMIPNLPNTAMERLGNHAHLFNRRLILKHVPRLDTLQVFMNGASIPREQISFVQSSNEILFRQNAHPKPKIGDEIQVSYEAAAR